MLTDFGIVSILIIFSHLLRSRVRLLQNLYMPSSIIAGLLCLVGGKEFLNWIPFSQDPAGKVMISTYPSILVVFLFATIFLGKKKRELSPVQMLEHAGDTFFYNMASLVGQYGFALLFGLLVLTPLFPMLPDGFAIFLPMGFIGGYGTSTAIGGVLEQHGWEGAQSIGYASATVGMLSAVVAGIVLVNVATRRGWTRVVETVQKMPKSMRTGFIEKEERHSMGSETVNPVALDPLTWHMAIVLTTGFLAFGVRDLFSYYFDGAMDIPAFGLALLIGAALQKIFNIMHLGQYVDRHVAHRIGSFVTDYLVVFGIASITTKVVIDNALPLILLFIVGFVFTIGLMWWVGRSMCRNFWFERSMAMYGWSTGSVATSVMLLRIIDPDQKTPVLEDFGLAYIGISVVEIVIIALLPPLIINHIIWGPTLVLVLAFAACIILSKFLVGWFPYSASEIRPGELEIMNNLDE